MIRRRTQFLLARARQRKHTVEGLLLAHANIDEVIRVIRSSATQPEAKARLMGIECPAALMRRALGEDGFANFISERGDRESYTLTAVQADAILRMTLGQLVNLEQEKLGGEYNKLLEEITEYLRILSSDQNILNIVREDLQELKKKHSDKRRTEISGEELGNIDMEDLITEENMVVTISHQGYVKRTAASTYRARAPRRQRPEGGQSRGRRSDRTPVCRQHARLSAGLYQSWQGLLGQGLRSAATGSREPWPGDRQPAQSGRRGKDRQLPRDRDFSQPDHYLIMATRRGQVKKTPLANTAGR